MKNLRQEMRTCVFNAFHEGTKKREMKAQGLGEDRVFSHTSAGVLLDRITDFSKFCKSCGINRLAKVTPEIAREYLESKVYTCSQKTVNEYRSELIKLGKICKVDLECEKVNVQNDIQSTRGAQAVISRPDFSKILEYCKEHPSKSAVCIMLEKEIGVRVSDIAYGINVDMRHEMLHIRCKNGKWCDRPITPAIKEIMALKHFQDSLVGDKFRPVKDNSINKQLRRIEDKLGLEHHSFHDLRRRVAQDKYDELRASGLSRSECLTAVSIWLNHGRNREQMMLKSYIADAW